MKRLWNIVLLYVLLSTVSAKFYIQELNPSSGNVQDVRDYSDALNLLRSIVPVLVSNEKSDVPKLSDESRELTASEEIPIEWDSDHTKIVRGREVINCYDRKHLSMICTNTCVGAIEHGCRDTGCQNKQKMKEFCKLPCKLAYNMYT